MARRSSRKGAAGSGQSFTQDARAFAATLSGAADLSEDDVEDALLEGGEIVRADAAARAPRAPGEGHGPGGEHLADNIEKQTTEKSKDLVRVVVGPGSGFWYGIFPEFGGAHNSPQPWLRPAFDENMGKVLSVLAHRLIKF